MRFFSFLFSLAVHLLVIVLGFIQLGDVRSLHVRLDVPAYQIELIGGGGGAKEKPAKAKEKAAPVKPVPPEPKPQTKPELKKEEAKPISPKKEKKEEPRKEPVKEKPAEKPKPEPVQPKKPTSEDILAEALRSAKQEAESKGSSRDVLARELAALQARSGNGGTGAGTGAGPGGPGAGVGGATLVQVYAAIVEKTVKQNWRYPAVGMDQNLVAQVELRIDPQGRIIGSDLVKSSGRADFDSSALRAVRETEQLPPPPQENLRIIRINFNLLEFVQ